MPNGVREAFTQLLLLRLHRDFRPNPLLWRPCAMTDSFYAQAKPKVRLSYMELVKMLASKNGFW